MLRHLPPLTARGTPALEGPALLSPGQSFTTRLCKPTDTWRIGSEDAAHSAQTFQEVHPLPSHLDTRRFTPAS